jgi:hypothetical protein
MDLSAILSARYGDKAWQLVGNEYENLTWYEEGAQPTKVELEALWPEIQYELAYAEVEEARAIAYRETSDPIFFEWQRGDKTEAEWLAAVQAVKDANPYPEDVTADETE